MTQTYTPISSIVLATDAPSVSFSNISTTYSHLVITAKVAGAAVLELSQNDNFNSIYARVFMAANAASGAFSQRSPSAGTQINGIPLVSIADTFQALHVEIFEANSTTKYKPVLASGYETGSSELIVHTAGQISSTAATTKLTINSVGLLKAGSVFSLYGIEA